MSAKARLAGKLPGNELINGIDPIATGLADRWDEGDPDKPAAVLVIGILRVRKHETVADDDGNRRKVPTLELSRLEQLGMLGREPLEILDRAGNLLQTVPVAPSDAQKLLLAAAETRTGDTPLPIDAESADDAKIEIIGEPETGNIVPLDPTKTKRH